MVDPIVRAIWRVEVFARQSDMEALIENNDNPATLEDFITDGPGIGDWEQTDCYVVDPRLVRDHLVRIGNDGTFFDPVDGDEDDDVIPTTEANYL